MENLRKIYENLGKKKKKSGKNGKTREKRLTSLSLILLTQPPIKKNQTTKKTINSTGYNNPFNFSSLVKNA